VGLAWRTGSPKNAGQVKILSSLARKSLVRITRSPHGLPCDPCRLACDPHKKKTCTCVYWLLSF